MNYRNFLAGAMAFALAACAAGCGDKSSSDTSSASEKETATTAPAETEAAEPETVEIEETTEELVPPTPTEASDPNTVTFDDGDFSFAYAKTEDPDSASGTLSVVEVMGNKMLKFTDDGTVPLDGKVQKIGINVVPLIGRENAAKVRRIEFDMYAEATAENLETESGELVKAPGWIGGGGGTVTAKEEKWYDFQEFEGGEYDFEMSGAVHGEFKFILADSGMCWSEDMEEPNFLIMRWGIANDSDMFIDNIVFYDEDGNSIPLLANGEAAEEGGETADEVTEGDSEDGGEIEAAEAAGDESIGEAASS